MNALKQLEAAGQSPWLDYVRRDMLTNGELTTLIDRDGLKGMTSNPSIFEKAIGHSDDYTDDLKQFQSGVDHGISEIYEHLAVADIRAAADGLRPVYDATHGRDGYISLEVSPYLANDTEGTVNEALRLWHTVDRRNLMVKVPATPAGIPAIRRLIAEGLNINVTLLFAVSAYEAVVEAYISGLDDRAKSGGAVDGIASVASFFVSRIDTQVDKQLEKAGERGQTLMGKVAIANAKVAYARYQALFAGDRWQKLAGAGAKTQRLLWASTGTKNPHFPDTLYVTSLIGRDTVNTLPPATLDAFRDHGEVVPDAITHDLDGAHAELAQLASLGVSLDDITRALVVDGVQQFADAFDQLLGAVARRRRTLFEGEQASLTIAAGHDDVGHAIAAEMEDWRKHGRIRQLWHGDATLWTNTDEAKWLGWLNIVQQEHDDLTTLQAFAKAVREGGATDVVLLGMGGSSLGPEVLAETFGAAGGKRISGFPRFHMLDSTDPAQIATLERAVQLATTLFITSSKSGSTLEPNIYMAHFLKRVGETVGADKAASHFAVVTDPGSALEEHARKIGVPHIFHGVKSIGGRYSVLSKFGLVPAAAMGIDIGRFLDSTQQMVRSCAEDVPPAENPGVQLGVSMGVAAKQFGRDKVTIVASPGIGDLGAWLEQLIAESTGKNGHGLVPVDAEPLADPARYGADRFFAYLELDGGADPAQRAAVDALEKAGHPVARIRVRDAYAIGQEFYRWEIATAVAGAVIGINPFDQPDVEASKIKTRALTDEYEKAGKLPEEAPVFADDAVKIYADPRNAAEIGRHDSLADYLRAHLHRAEGGRDYVALLAYIERNAHSIEVLTHLRTQIRDATRAATCVGFGPRFLHSTGQAYKGGPNTGVFLQITCDDAQDIPVPDHRYTFGVVKAAQARGDLGVLLERDRRALRVHLTNAETGLQHLATALGEALGQ